MRTVDNLSKTRIKNMKKQELQDLCEDLGINVTDCKLKAHFVDKILAYQEQRRGSGAEPSEVKPRVSLEGGSMGGGQHVALGGGLICNMSEADGVCVWGGWHESVKRQPHMR